MKVLTCETIAAIVVHARHEGDRPVRYGGHARPKPVSLCGRKIDWDTRRPLSSVSCRHCLEALTKVQP